MFPQFNHRSQRIECKTLVQTLPSTAADAELSAALNAGWTILNLSVAPVIVPGEQSRYGVEMPARLQVMRVVTMQRAICPPETPAAAAQAVIVTNGHKPVVPQADAQPVGEAGAKAVDAQPVGEAGEQFVIIEPNRQPKPRRVWNYSASEEEWLVMDIDREPVPPKLRGRVLTAAQAALEERRAHRKPVDEVTFSEAVRSGGLYSAEEIIEIGNREAMAAARRAYQAHRSTDSTLRPLSFWLNG